MSSNLPLERIGTARVEDDTKRDDQFIEQDLKPNGTPYDVIMKSPFEDLGIKETFKVFKKCVFVCLLASFSAAADGYQIALTGNIIANKGFILQYGTSVNAAGAVILNADHVAAWGGVQSAGQGIGMLTQHFISDRYGRKYSFYLLWVVLVIAVALESFGRDWRTWLVAKITSGFGVGSVQYLTSLYMTELCPGRIRGFLLIFYSVWYSFGQLFSSIALKFNNDRDPFNYLLPIYTEWAMIGIMLMIYLIIPETPYWCATRGHHERGAKVLRFLNGGIPGYDVDFHYDIIRRAVEKEAQYQVDTFGESKGFFAEVTNVRDVLTGINGFRTLIAFWPAFLQQISGLAVLSTYSAYFAQIANFADPFLFTLLLGIIAVAACIIEASLIDVIGRRNLFLGGMVANWIFCIGIGFCSLAAIRTVQINNLIVAFSLLWRVGSTMLGSLGWSFVAEAGSTRLRAKTAGFAAAGGVAFGLIFNTTVPYMLNENRANWGLKTCFFFAGISIPFVILSFFIIPDTSRRTPAELDEMFRKKVRPWRFRSYVTDAKKALDAERERTGETDLARLQHTRG